MANVTLAIRHRGRRPEEPPRPPPARHSYGLPERLDVFYDNNPVFARPSTPDIRTIAWFDSANPVRSGWAWGQQRLDGTTAVADVSVGPGRLILLGPLVAFRAQPHGTFKLPFNSLHYARAEAARLR